MKNALLVCSALLLPLVACIQPSSQFDGEGKVVGSPSGFPGFPLETSHPNLWVEAALVTDSDDRFGIDLSAYGVLAVAVRLGTLTVPDVGMYLEPGTLDARLFLQDGTSLAWIPPDTESDTRALARTLQEHSLPYTVIRPWRDGVEGFLFFDLTEDIRVKEHYALTHRDTVYREVNLHHGLLSFRLSGDGGTETIRVGLRKEFRGWTSR